MKKLLFKSFIILIVISLFVQTISFFPFYIFVKAKEQDQEILLNEQEEINQSDIPLDYELIDLRSEYQKVFKRIDGTLEYSYYDEMVNYHDGTSYQEVDASYKYVNNELVQTINKYSVYLPKKLHENKKIKLQVNSSSIELIYHDIQKTEGQIIKNDNPTDKISSLKNIKGTINYQNIKNNVDLQITSSGTKFKEDLILNKYIDNFTFSYTLKLKNLYLENINNSYLFKDNEGNILYEMQPYIMIDNKNNTSTNVSIEITQTKDDEYLFSITPDNKFLQQADYPVIIDPVITYTANSSTSSVIKTKTIIKNYTTTTNGFIQVTKFLSKYENASGNYETIDSGCYGIMEISSFNISSEPIKYARLSLKGASASYTQPVSFGRINTQESYEDINGYSNYTVTNKSDFENVGDGYYTVDFTKYTEVNRSSSQIYELSPENFLYNEDTQTFQGHSGTVKPMLVIVQASDSGMSPYRQYENIDANQAGNIYVDSAQGNMFVEKNIYSHPTNKLSLSYYYSSLSKTINYGYGNGFKTNYDERLIKLKPLPLNKLKIVNGTGYTEYFYYDANLDKYHSEEGSNYFIQYYSNTQTYELIADTYTKVYNSDGYLIKILNNTDTNNYDLYDIITIDYSNNNISQISLEDMRITFTYVTNNNESLIQEIKVYQKIEQETLETLIQKTTFEYSTDDNLIKINKYINNNNIFDLSYSVHYNYDENNLLNKLYSSTISTDFILNPDNYAGISLNYNNDKVQSYSLKTINDSILKQLMSINYQNDTTTFTDFTGYQKTYVFDYFNHTICLIDSKGYAVYYKYENFLTSVSIANPKYTHKNRILYISDTTNVKYNPIYNGSFENDSVNNGWNITNGQIEKSIYSPFGHNVLELSKKITSENSSYATQSIYLNEGTYTISALTKVLSIDNELMGYIKVYDENQNLLSNSMTIFTNDSFEFKSNTFYVNEAKQVTIELGMHTEDGILTLTDYCYFDNVTLGENSYNNTTNLIPNSSFEETSTWNYINRTERIDPNEIFGNYELSLEPNRTTKFELNYDTKPNDSFNLGGFVKYLNGITNVRITIQFCNNDNNTTSAKFALRFNPEVSSYQYACNNITVPGEEGTTYNKIKIEITNIGGYTAYVDNIHLYPIYKGTEYKYNEDLNKVSELTTSDGKTKIEYKSNKISKVTSTKHINKYLDPISQGPHYITGNEIEEIDKLNNNTSVSFNTYNYLNNSEKESITFSGNYETEGFFTKSTYENYNSFLKSSTDEFGNTTSYEYNYQTGNISKITNALNQQFEYIDSNNDSLIDKYVEKKNSTTIGEIEYTYNDYNKLSSIKFENIIYSFTYDNYGNIDTILKNNQSIKDYDYYYYNNINTGLVEKETSADGSYYKYTYNDNFQQTACYKGKINENLELEEVLCYTCIYNESKNLGYYFDNIQNIEYYYSYDLAQNLTKLVIQEDQNTDTIEYIYDEKNTLKEIKITIDGITQTTSFAYSESEDLQSITIDDVIFTNPTEYTDSLRRTFTEQVKKISSNGEDTLIDIDYTYANSSLDYADELNISEDFDLTSTRISSQTITIDNQTFTLNYTYNEIGNITEMLYDAPGEDNDLVYMYLYDNQNYLNTEVVLHNDNLLLEVYFMYDSFGNIISIYRNIFSPRYQNLPTEQIFTYNAQKQLTSYTIDGVTYNVNYDIIGNPDKFKDYNLTFDSNQLIQLTNSTNTITYTYNAEGLRTSKTVNGIKTEYEYIGDNLYQQKIYLLNNTLDYSLRFMYDENNKAVGFKLINNDGTIIEEAYYVRNINQDIIKLVNDEGQIIGEYIYDAYGNIVNEEELSIFAYENPFRYKGYYHDKETNLYYCQTRYYSPEICRWISIDKIEYLTTNSIVGLNLYAYCNNNPIMNYDPSGNASIIVILAFILSGILGLLAANSHIKQYEDNWDEDSNVEEYTTSTDETIFYEIDLNEENTKKSTLKIYNSYRYNKKEIEEFLNFLKIDKGYSEINIDKVRNEWRWHKIAYKWRFEQKSTASVDAFFDHDDEGHGVFSDVMNNVVIF